MLIGYARVSTPDQDLGLQLAALEAAGVERTYRDVRSGSGRDRPGLEEAKRSLRKGDVLVVWKLDRLGRSLRHLVEFVGDLRSQGVEFRSLTDAIDTTTPGGRFFFHVMAALAEMELELIRERTHAGLAEARRRGNVGGRPSAYSERKAAAAWQMKKQGMAASEIAESFGISRATLYRWLQRSERDS